MRRIRHAVADTAASAAVEFALIATPFLLMLLALVDLGFRQYMTSHLQGVMDRAARQVTVGGVTQSTITNYVTTQMRLILPSASVTVVPKSYYDFATVGKPEPITTDTAPLGQVNAGDCYTDLNGNKTWDSDASKSGMGGGDDIVYYTATASYPAIVPMTRWLGWSSTEQVSATAMMRNQPYAAQGTPATICL